MSSQKRYENDESVRVGDYKELTTFCTFLGGDRNRKNACKDIGKEWGDPRRGDRCTYSLCNKIQRFSPGCRHGCCGISGRGVKCKRLYSTGDPLKCCFNNCVCQVYQGNKCFSDSNKDHTCSFPFPNYRNISSPSCQKVLLDYCSGNDLDDEDTSWTNRWALDIERSCTKALYKNIRKSSICSNSKSGPYFSVGVAWATLMLNSVYTKIAKQNISLRDTTNHFHTKLREALYQICKNEPLICESLLTNYCKKLTIEDLAIDQNLVKWCGCHLPTKEYQKYINVYKISKECTPTCNNSLAIKSTNFNEKLECKQSVCLIDDVSFAISNSSVRDGVKINQICGNCTNQNCNCMIQDSKIYATDTIINGRIIPVQQICGSKVRKVVGSNGQILTFPDKDNVLYETYLNIDKKLYKDADESRFNNLGLIFLIVIILIVLVLMSVRIF